MYGTIIQQGSFITANTANQILNLRSDVDWIQTRNWTTINAGLAANTAIMGYWQRTFAANEGLMTIYNATPAMIMATSSGLAVPGFNLINTSTAALGANIAVASGTNATQPVYGTANTLGLANGSIVRIYNTDHDNINGLDFSIDTLVANTSFRLANTLATAPGVVAGAAGTYRMVAPDITYYNRWYPSKRVICNITAANPGVVTTLVDHSLTTGQKVRIIVPATCGMTELSNQIVTITVVNASTFSIGVDTTAYTAFNYPLPAIVPFTPAEMIPVGIDPLFNTSLLDATINQDYMGISLGYGQLSPCGVNGNIIYWVAGKSINV